MSANKNWLLRIVFFTAFIILYLIFNRYTVQNSAEPLTEFDTWVINLVELSRKGEIKQEQTPKLSLVVLMKDSTRKTFQISGDTKERQAMRLIELARETRLFANKSESITIDQIPPHARYALTISSADKMFAAFFSPEDIKDNVPAKNLLKLFEIYTNT